MEEWKKDLQAEAVNKKTVCERESEGETLYPRP